VRRQALPVDPALGEYPAVSEFRPARLTRFVPVSGHDGQLPPIETTRASEAPPGTAGRAGQAMSRLLVGLPLDASAIAMERMRKLVALPVLSADALSSVAYGPEAMLAILVLAGSPGLSYSLPVAAGLLIDYVMTVAVSIASGVAAITSAFPSLQPSATVIGLGVIAALLAGNLRGCGRRAPFSPRRRTRSSRPSPPS
jgi:hypothetical protein